MCERIISIIVTLVWAGTAFGQIGLDGQACRQTWGDPVSGLVDSNGCGTLVFGSEKGSVEVGFLEGVARRVVYRSWGTNDSAIGKCLEDNGQGVAWQMWSPPGAGGDGEPVRRWIRGDEMAMARLVGGDLTVMGWQWDQCRTNTTPPAERAPSGTEPAEKNSASVQAVPALKPGPPAVLPATGAPRETAIRLLGQPGGRMKQGPREALVYPWGTVWCQDDKVMAVE